MQYRLLALLALMLAAPAHAAQWKMLGPAAGLTAQSVSSFAGRITQSSRGSLTLALSPEADGRRVLDALASGKAVAGVFTMAALETANPVLAMDRVPYLGTNFVDAEKLWRVLKPHVENSLAGRGLVLLYAVASPPEAPISGRPLVSLADWRGSRLLTTRPALDHLSRILGAQAVRGVSSRDALLGRTADVVFMDPHTAVVGKAWEFASHYLDAPAWFPKQLVVVRRDALDALDAGTRAALGTVSRDAEAESWRVARKASEDSVQKLRDYGIKTLKPPVGVLIQLEALGRELLFLWSDAAGEAGAKLVEDYYAIR